MIHTASVLYTQGSNKRGTEVRYSIHIRQNSAFSCSACHWRQSSSSGQINGNNIHRDNTATCSLLRFPAGAPNVTSRCQQPFASQQGSPPTWQNNYLFGAFGAHWPHDLRTCSDKSSGMRMKLHIFFQQPSLTRK